MIPICIAEGHLPTQATISTVAVAGGPRSRDFSILVGNEGCVQTSEGSPRSEFQDAEDEDDGDDGPDHGLVDSSCDEEDEAQMVGLDKNTAKLFRESYERARVTRE